LKFPWVSRERLEEAEKRLTAADAERLRLLDLLLGGAVPDRRPVVAQTRTVEPEIDDGIRPITNNEDQGTQASFSTPFDRVLSRFDAAHKGGKIPVKFQARTN
jgi:hypothetical protein